MPRDPYGNDEFLGTGHPEPGEGLPTSVVVATLCIVLIALAAGLGVV